MSAESPGNGAIEPSLDPPGEAARTTRPGPAGTTPHDPTMAHAATHREDPDSGGRSPLLEMLVIAAPTVATMTSYTAMQFVDKWMVSQIEPPDAVYVAAQGNGGLVAFVPIAIIMGLLQVINTYVSQNYGAGRPERGAAYGWNSLWIALFAQVLLVPYILLVPHIFGSMNHSERLVALETEYAQVLLLGAFFTMATRGIAHFFYGLHRPMTVLLAALIGNVVNVAANWVFIYGNLGAPALGVTGAAVGTIIGTGVELCIPIAVFVSPRYARLFGTRGAWRPSWAHVADIFRIGWPAALMFGSEIVCWGYFMTELVGRFGEAQNTAGWIALQYMHLSFMPAIGISIAVTAMVGKAMGMKRPDIAARRAYLGMGVTMGYMGLCALGFFLFRHALVSVFLPEGLDDAARAEILRIGGWVMVVAAAFQLFDAIAVTISAALRGAGDTVWPGVLTMILAWSVIVGGGHAAVALAPGLESLGPWIASAIYVIALGSILLIRFARGRWRSLDLLARSAGSLPPGGGGADVEPPDPMPVACIQCGFDRTGLEGRASCPACGTEPTPSTVGPAA